MRISYINGEYVDHTHATVHIEDRGYQFSDGVYEVVYIHQGVCIDWQAHMERLRFSLEGIKINYKVDSETLLKVTQELVARNKLTNAMLYLQITRGVSARLHPFPKPSVSPVVVMTIAPCEAGISAKHETGVATITTRDTRWKLRHYKTISLLPNVLAKQEAVEQGVEEAILVEDDGTVTEGSATNIFIVDAHGVLYTHPANEAILGGITRQGVIDVAKENGYAVTEKPFMKERLYDASEMFMTSTTKHILPIISCDGKIIGDGVVGDVTASLMDAYRASILKQQGENV